MELQNYSALLSKVLQSLAHDAISVEQQWTSLKSVVLVAKCQKYEQGLIMGAKVANVKALQKIFRAIGEKNGDKISITIEGTGKVGKQVNGFKPWNEDEAETLFSELIRETGHEIIDIRMEPYRNGTAMVVLPSLSPELHDAFHTVMEIYGKSRNRNFGLIHSEELV